MSNKQTLQKIWSITDKPIIDIMTKTKDQSNTTRIQNNSDDNTDSDSSESSEGSFVAVPEEFRPNLPPQLTKEKNITSKVSCNQNFPKPSIQNENPPMNEFPNNKLTISSTENRKPEFVELKKRMKSPNANESSVTPPPILRHMSSTQNTNNRERNIKNCEIVRPSFTTRDLLENVPNNALSYQKHHVPISKETKIKKQLQCEYVKREHGTIQLNFDLPLAREKISVSKDALKYEATFSQDVDQKKEIISKSENTNSYFKAQVNYGEQYQVASQEKIIKWDSTLSLNEENAADQNKIKWTVITHDKQTTISERKRNFGKKKIKQFNNDSKPANFNKSRQPLKGSTSIRRDCPLQGKTYQHSNRETLPKYTKSELREPEYSLRSPCYKNDVPLKNNLNIRTKISNYDSLNEESFTKPANFNQSRKTLKGSFSARRDCPLQAETYQQLETLPKYIEPKLSLRENKYSLQSPSYKNDAFLDNNLNNIRVKTSNYDFLDEESFMQQCNIREQNITSNQSIYECLSNVSEKNLHELNPNRGINSKSNNPDSMKEKNDGKLKSILHYGKDMTDLIIGSHRALSMLVSFYKEWKISRCELVKHFETLENNLKESSERCARYKDIIAVANKGANFAAAIPHPYALLAARIVSVLTGLFSTFLNKSKKDGTDDTNEITTCLQRDTQASSDLYIYGIQCNQQFEETTKLIEEFHKKATEEELFAVENREIVKFIQGMLEYRPTHRIFYKKLHKCFQELLQTCNSSSNSSIKDFCEPFFLYSLTTVDVIGYLNWRFHNEEFNSESVRYELENLHRLMQDNNAIPVNDLVKRIQNCIRILKDELIFVERCLKDISLFDDFPEHSKGSSDFSTK